MKRKIQWLVYWMSVVLLLTACARDRGSVCETLDNAGTGDEKFPVDILVFVDSSGSMTDSDPGNLRMEATRRIMERITEEKALSGVTRVGVVSFRDDADVVVSLREPSAARDAVSGISSSASGNTDLLAALHRGYQAFAAAGTFPERKPVILLLTDGSPYDFRRLKGVKAYFLEIQAFVEEKLKPLGCGIYVVGIDARGRWNRVEGYWRETADGVCQAEDMEQLEQVLGSIVEQVYGIPPVAREIVAPGRELAFTVPPYTEELIVYVLSQGSDGHLTLYRPDGSAIVEGERGVMTQEYGSYESIGVAESTHGDWIMKARGGEFAVYRKLVPYRLKLIEPEGVHPLGKPLQMEIAFLRSDGKPVAELPGYRLRFLGRIRTPGGQEHELTFETHTAGRYMARSALVPELEGSYEVVLAAQGGDAFRCQVVETIEVKLMPYPVITEPTDSQLGLGDLEVGVSVFQAGEPLSAQQLRDVSALARLQSPGGQVSTAWLELVPDSRSARLRGWFPNALREEGQYQLEVMAVGWDAGAATLVLHTRRGFLSQLRRRVAYAGAGLTGMVLLAFLGFLIRARKYPRIAGSISAYLSSDGEAFLGQRRFYRKNWGFLHLRNHEDASGRWFLVAGASADGDEAVDVWYRTGLTFARRRLYQDDMLELGEHTLKYN